MAAFQSMVQMKDNFSKTNSKRIMFLIFHIPNTSLEHRKALIKEIFVNISITERQHDNIFTYITLDNTRLVLLEVGSASTRHFLKAVFKDLDVLFSSSHHQT